MTVSYALSDDRSWALPVGVEAVVVSIIGQSNPYGTNAYWEEWSNETDSPTAPSNPDDHYDPGMPVVWRDRLETDAISGKGFVWDKCYPTVHTHTHPYDTLSGPFPAGSAFDIAPEAPSEFKPIQPGFGRSHILTGIHGQAYPVRGVGPELGLVWELERHLHVPVYVIKCCKGGTSIITRSGEAGGWANEQTWNPDEATEAYQLNTLALDYYIKPALQDLKDTLAFDVAAGDKVLYMGTAMMQGAADSASGLDGTQITNVQTNYQMKLAGIVSLHRTDLGVATLPWLQMSTLR